MEWLGSDLPENDVVEVCEEGVVVHTLSVYCRLAPNYYNILFYCAGQVGAWPLPPEDYLGCQWQHILFISY